MRELAAMVEALKPVLIIYGLSRLTYIVMLANSCTE